jgi:hypothetical protein
MLAIDCAGHVFEFNQNDPAVKKWSRPRAPSDGPLYENRIFLVADQWYHHAGHVWMAHVFEQQTNKPNYARFFTREEARDWFLAGNMLLPEELAEIRPAKTPTPIKKPDTTLSPNHKKAPEILPGTIQSNTLIAHGKRNYSLGSNPPYYVDQSEDNVLQAFLQCSGALNFKSLIDFSGEPNARKILKGLTVKYKGAFAPAIKLPGAKGRGGYRVSIRRA